MAGPTTGGFDVTAEVDSRVREALAAQPGGVLEQVAQAHGVPYGAVLDRLDAGQAIAAPGAMFDAVWSELASWSGEVTFIVHTADGVFETRGAIPPGTHGRGFFNIHGESPIGGHIRADHCAAIYLVDRPFMGRRSCSVQFVNHEGGAMFKVFVGRDGARELDPVQVRRFEAVRARLGDSPRRATDPVAA